MRKQEEESGNTVVSGTPRKAYKKPGLTIYGKIAEVTAGATGSMPDPGHATPTRRA